MIMHVSLAAAGCVLALAGCGNGLAEGSNSGRTIDNQPVDVYRYPPGIADVAVQCDGPDAVYSSQGGGVFVVQNSVHCANSQATR